MVTARRLLALLALFTTVAFACESNESSDGSGGGGQGPTTTGATDENLRVAFIGDQGLGANPEAVLQLIEDEGTDLVIHPGDFDYEDDPAAWDDMIDRVLGPDYPYFGTVGNHDVDRWSGADGYQAKLQSRLERIDGVECSGGDLGVRSACWYRGLYFILSGVGTTGFFDHVEYLDEALGQDDSIWRLCTWHKNREDFQAGTKGNAVLLGAYESCAKGRAVIVNAHEHSYSRTLTLTDIGNPAAGYGASGAPDVMEVKTGSTFVAVSGLAGASVRDYAADLHMDDTWWATIYAQGKHLENGEDVSTADFTYGALFVDFHVDGDPKKARGYFKTIAGNTVDEFTVVTE